MDRTNGRTARFDGRLPPELRDRACVRGAQLRISLSRYCEAAVSYALSRHAGRMPTYRQRELARTLSGDRVRQSLSLSPKGRESLELHAEQLQVVQSDALAAALLVAEETPLDEIGSWAAKAVPPDGRRREAAVG